MFSFNHIKQSIIAKAPHISKSINGDKQLNDFEMYAWAFNYGVQMELDLKNKITKNLSIKLDRYEDYDQDYVNSTHIDKMRRFYFEVEYDQELWSGPRTGSQIIHKRIIEKSLMDSNLNNEIINRECDSGKVFVSKRIPEAVYRVGCYCCYGSGPDLSITYNTLENGNLEIIYTVDFDFNTDDYIDNH